MAKAKKKVYGKKQYIGSIKKRKDGTGDYLVINKDFEAKQGMYLNLEKPQDQIANIQEAVEKGNMDEDKATEIIARLEKDIEYGTRFSVTYQEVKEE